MLTIDWDSTEIRVIECLDFRFWIAGTVSSFNRWYGFGELLTLFICRSACRASILNPRWPLIAFWRGDRSPRPAASRPRLFLSFNTHAYIPRKTAAEQRERAKNMARTTAPTACVSYSQLFIYRYTCISGGCCSTYRLAANTYIRLTFKAKIDTQLRRKNEANQEELKGIFHKENAISWQTFNSIRRARIRRRKTGSIIIIIAVLSHACIDYTAVFL